MDNYSVVGKRIKNRDATSKVTGKATFTGDIKLRGMLFGKILRSSVPHARILNIDVSGALKLKGVKIGEQGSSHYFHSRRRTPYIDRSER